MLRSSEEAGAEQTFVVSQDLYLNSDWRRNGSSVCIELPRVATFDNTLEPPFFPLLSGHVTFTVKMC